LDYLFVIPVILFLLIIVATIVVSIYQTIATVFNFFFEDIVNRHLIFVHVRPSVRRYLQSNFKYYQRLSDDDKVVFERRLEKFIKMKNFEPRGGLEFITPEMEILIGASAIQITFGFPSLYFKSFDTILVYPDSYQSSITGHFHHGEVNTRGFIVLSWAHFLKGYLVDDDGRNLGLHEMAHALKFTDAIQSDEYNFMDTSLMNHFFSLARVEMARIANGEHSFFRDYAATNDSEFFAVAVENFFERPEKFEQNHPELFNILAELLNQQEYIKSASAVA
jgi:Mlc titration factor MtfA (ptsG expression regulator)